MKISDNIITRVIKDRDHFGVPVGLSMEGRSSYQTIPGGLLSLFLSFVVICYASLVWDGMTSRQDWTLI